MKEVLNAIAHKQKHSLLPFFSRASLSLNVLYKNSFEVLDVLKMF